MKSVEYHSENRVARITLNRADKRNAMNEEVVQGLHDAFDMAASDTLVKLVILQAKGEVFCAGADLAYLQRLQSFSYEDNLKDSQLLGLLYHKMYTFDKVIIAQVQGHTLAGGCGLITVCDFVFAASGAKFGYTEARIGFVPALVMPFLLRRVGESHTRTLLLSGERISTEKAMTIGLVYRVVNPDKLKSSVDDFASELINDNAGASMTLTKRMLTEIQGIALDEELGKAAEANAKARATDDCKRGIAAFLNKERIRW